MKQQKKNVTKKTFIKPFKSILNSLPMMLGIIFLLGLINEFISFERISNLFTGNPFIDPIIGSFAGSILAGNSMNSYIIGKELLNSGVSMFAVTAFLVSWVTVGLIQIPIESENFGMSFAIKRNLFSAILAIIVSLITVSLWRVL